jgi:pyrimidine deaminase RibD-like protein
MKRNEVYENYLKNVLKFLKNSWHNPYTGIVAAGLFLSDSDYVIATSTLLNNNIWIHAERNVFNLFEKKYSNDYSKATLVLSLSPCLLYYQKSRIGSSCSQMILERNIHSIFVGVIDKKQASNGYQDYKAIGITFDETEDDYNLQVCSKLYSLFEEYNKEINTNLLRLKKSFFNHIFE